MKGTRIAFTAILTLSIVHAATAQTPPAVAPVPPAAVPPSITVLSTGTGPKRPVRYRATPGASDRIEVSMKMAVDVDVPDAGPQHIEPPPMRIVIDVDVEDVAANGDITSRMAIVSASMEGPGMPAGMLDMLKGLSGAMVISDRGLLKSMTFDTSGIADPNVQSVMSSMGFERLATPMPEEPVGVGAKWEVVQALSANNMQMNQRATYELVAMDATSMTFDVIIAQSAPAQAVAPLGMPAGTSLVSVTGEGSGRMTLPDGALTLFGDMSIRSEVVMGIDDDGVSRRMSTATALTMSIARGKR